MKKTARKTTPTPKQRDVKAALWNLHDQSLMNGQCDTALRVLAEIARIEHDPLEACRIRAA